MQRHNLLRGFMQITRTGVITQPGPQMQNFIQRRMGQIRYRWEARHKALKIGDNGRNLSLLQHYLREPYFVRRLVNLPGQRFPPVFVVPAQNLSRKLRRLHDYRFIIAGGKIAAQRQRGVNRNFPLLTFFLYLHPATNFG